jgi:pyruvate dehydrogenase E2 component (dihydrolipoamide acetyltransferase)
MMSFYRSQKAKVGCTVNDVIVLACARAIMEFPAMHSRIDGDTILEFPGANIGVAVGMDDGLVVPVVMNAEQLTLAQLAVETKRLANQARAGKIENMGQGIFTISNLGMFGIDEFVAIINPPEASLLAVGAVHEDVLVKGGALRAAQVLNLTLSADHRLIDGTLGSQFMARLKALLEEPVQLIA